ncbi:RNA-directed DNA polymerase [Priestia megaterium]|uniref:RNA-directed DNA polymerase n=1 Tax=Priestia megaterium TaxID=1404 RepID=UPI0039F6970C
MNKLKPVFLLDLLPFELPLIYSNEDLYTFIMNNDIWDKTSIDDVSIEETQPYNFYIFKNDLSNRLISLLHPLSQIQSLKFIEKYDNEIINFFNTNAIYSIRYPNRINSIKQKSIDKINSEMTFILNENFEVNNNDYEKYMDSYFSKYRFKKITDFYKSNIFKKLETKYSLLQKLDISNCFYSIYTHSIDWAYLGSKEYAKENRNNKRFSAKLDEIMRTSNFSETNGIVVGPEFSRIVAEIIFTRIDKLVYEKLKLKKIFYKQDYEIVRYIDDIFIFSNNAITSEIIKNVYVDYCNDYKLKINESKAFIEHNPFFKKHIWVVKLKKILKEYFNLFDKPSALNKSNIGRVTNSFIEEIRSLIIEFEEDKHSIVSFVLSSIEKVWEDLISKTLSNMEINEHKSYLLFKFVDIIHYILTFSITTQNVIKYTKLTILIKNESLKIDNEAVQELIFKKSLELIKYHNNKSTEILNLIIAVKTYPKELPEKILLDFLIQNTNYFTLSVITYYLSEGSRSFRYKKIKNFINTEVNKILENLNEKYILPSTNKKKIKKLLTTSDFYIIHDLYSSNILNKSVKKEIEKIKRRINNERWESPNEALFKLFVGYIKEFDKPFMKWNTTDRDLIKVLIEKTHTVESQAYS